MKEIEAHFLDIDTELLKQKLSSLKADDLGEEMLTEWIFYDIEGEFVKNHKMVRIRLSKKVRILPINIMNIQSWMGLMNLR